MRKSYWLKGHCKLIINILKHTLMDEKEFGAIITKLATSNLTEDQLKRLKHLANNWSMYKQ